MSDSKKQKSKGPRVYSGKVVNTDGRISLSFPKAFSKHFKNKKVYYISVNGVIQILSKKTELVLPAIPVSKDCFLPI